MIDELHDELGDWIDPLLAVGIGLVVMGRAEGFRAVLAAAVLVSLLIAIAATCQPVRSATDYASEQIATRLRS